MSEPSLGTWTVAESPITVEYSLDVIEQVRVAVQEGFQRLSRGGVEVGGVLYGTRQGRAVRILAQRPIPCEHARGPAFLLSDADKAGLAALLDRKGPELQEMGVVGWYVSHTKSEICLSDTDKEIFDAYFAAPSHVTLVLRPGRYGGTRAGFFVREADGTVQSHRSYLDFNVPDRTSSAIERAPGDRPPPHSLPSDRTPQSRTQLLRAARQAESTRELVRANHEGDRLQDRLEPPRFTAPSLIDGPQFLAPESPKRSKTWLWLLLWAASLAATGFGVHYVQQFATAAEPLALQVMEREGQLQIEWNRASRSITSAARGVLSITEGNDVKEVPLSTEELAKGKFTYVRHAGEVQLKLTVFSSEGKPAVEGTRFLGQPVAAKESDELVAMRRQRDQLAEEVKRLEGEAETQTAKLQQLERTIRILESRLQIRGAQP